MIIDVHSHLFMYNELDKRINENLEKNVKIIIENGLNTKTNKKVIEESKKYNIIYYALGFHPVDIVRSPENEIEEVIEFILKNKDEKFIAIGEIGLDFYWVKDEKLIKKEIFWFEKFLEIAEKINKPVILHSRKAEKETIEISKNYKCKKILHSFWNIELVKSAIENEFYFSIPAFVYKDKYLQKIAEKIPIDLILTETDSPFLDPIGKRENNSWKIIYGLEMLSKIKNIDKDELAANIAKNFEKIFNIKLFKSD
ncbi:MAG: TatD family hydrolase [Nanopusillaceae archaeon]